jgi:uncharacterized iron-regulated membrane protein
MPMRIKRVFFWMHLCTAVTASVVILIMSVTGILLTYEHQVVAAARERNRLPTVSTTQALPVDRLAQIAREVTAPSVPVALIFTNDPAAPVSVSLGRQGTVLLNPYTGSAIKDASVESSRFFRKVEDWHRFLNMQSRATGSAITGAANFMFLFLAISGVYIWLPDAWRWPAVKFRMLFARKVANSKVRDFNWHHVFSFWMVIPLFLIALSGVVISYGWASNLVFAAFGEQAPQRFGPMREPGGASRSAGPSRAPNAPEGEPKTLQRATLQMIFAASKGQYADWRTLSVPLANTGPTVNVSIERHSAAPRPTRSTLALNAGDATVVSLTAPDSGQRRDNPGQRLRVWFRFVHTGEQYGVVGQTIAGIATVAACFLVYTGLALAYRRLIRPLLGGAKRNLPPETRTL